MRNLFFWLYDFIHGSRVKKHLNEIRYVIEHPNSDKAKQLKNKNLHDILLHAATTSPFYIDKNLKGKSLQEFPVINKIIIQDNYNDFLSSTYKDKKARISFTSGSTGIPLKVYQNDNKIARNTADTIYFSSLAGYKLGEKLFYIKLWTNKNHKSKTTLYLQNIIPHNTLKNSEKDVANFADKLIKIKGKKSMVIYPSFLMALCDEIEKRAKNINYNMKSILTMSESLSVELKERASNLFKVPVLERYSNIENGILAQQTIKNPDRLKINTASYKIEVLKMESDEPAEENEVGRVVITDFFNYAFPFIRYDTGDLAILKEINGEYFIENILGRKMDMIYDTKGNLVLPQIVYKMYFYSETRQYQFIQQGEKEYIFRLNSTKEKTQEKEMIAFFKTILGDDAQFSFDYTNEIPLLTSGKHKVAKNNYIKM